MDIVHVIFQMLTGGMETMLADIVNEQVRRGHRVEILIVNRGEDPAVMASIDSRVKISRFNRRPGASPLLLMARLNAWMLRRRPDIIHLHMHKLTGLLRVMRSRTLYTVHDLRTPMTYAARSNMAAISEAVAADVRNRVPGARIEVITNAIDMEEIAVRPDGKPLDRPVKIVQISRLLSEKKGQDILIDALRLLGERGYRVCATFIGDGPDLDDLRRRAEGLDVTFTGNLPRREIYAMLGDFDLMCHPARYEGFGLTVAEGMAAGLPLVIPEGGGPWEVADRGRLAETFVPESAESCAEALVRVIDAYPAALIRAAEARKRVEALYSMRRLVDDYDALYRRLPLR